MSDKRINIILIGLLLFFLSIGFRLWQIQIMKHAEFDDVVENQSQDSIIVTSLRGSIFDRDSNLLVFSEKKYKLFADVYTLQSQFYDSLANLATILTGKKQNNYKGVISAYKGNGLLLEKNILTINRKKIEKFREFGLNTKSNIDEEGNTLYSIFLDPDSLRNHYFQYIADNLSVITGNDKSKYFYALTNNKGRISLLEQHLTQKQRDAVDFLNIRALIPEEKTKRNYQYGSLLSNVLGFVGSDGKGKMGIEGKWEKTLAGENGYKKVIKNGDGQIITVLKNKSRTQKDGTDIYLTINKKYQEVLEGEIKKCVESTGAKNGVGIIMNPNTGEVLSLVNYPTFDPGNYGSYGIETMSNRAISEHYDPGSTFKGFTLAAGLDSKNYDLNDIIFAENGVMKIGKETIKDVHKYGNINVREALAHSSNIAFAKMALKIGIKPFYKYLSNFGIGVQTGIELPNEASGNLLPPKNRNQLTTAFVAHGYSISMTPLQLIAGYSALINGGKVVKPYIIKKMVNKEPNETFETKPQVIREVISTKTSDLVKEAMKAVVTTGTAKVLQQEKYQFAGKTGTSQTYIPGKGYSKNQYHASFIGFYPVENPEILCLIVIDSPSGAHQGGAVAAPIFNTVLTKIFTNESEIKTAQRQVEYENKSIGKLIPDLLGKNKSTCDRILAEIQVPAKYSGNGLYVKKQSVNPINYEVTLELGNYNLSSNQIQMPELIGLSLREAISILKINKLNFKVYGKGYVKNQNIPAGESVKQGSLCILNLKEEG